VTLRAIYEGTFSEQDHLRLSLERQTEDEYQQVVQQILRKAGAPDEVAGMYRDWKSFSGGWDNLRHSLEQAADIVFSAGAKTGAELPRDLFCGVWPDRRFNAFSARTPSGGLVFVNTGLLVGIRRLAQIIAESTEAILGASFAGPDRDTAAKFATESDAMLDHYMKGIDVRKNWRINVLQGPRESLRRAMIFDAICFVIAHEAGHLARNRPAPTGWTGDNEEWQKDYVTFDPAKVREPPHEIDVIRGFSRESYADLVAAIILHQAWISHPVVPLSQLLGAMMVPALLAADWWRRAAFTDAPLGFTHPAPEQRMQLIMFLMTLSAEDRQQIQAGAPANSLFATLPADLQARCDNMRRVGKRFAEWSAQVLGITHCKEVTRVRGLGNRGLNPESLVWIYLTDSQMPSQPSDIVQKAFRS
jgi:hypothetical protein